MGRGRRDASPLRRRRRPPARPRRDQQLLRARLHLLRHPRRQPRRRALPRAPPTSSWTAPARPRRSATARSSCRPARTTASRPTGSPTSLRRIRGETGLAAITLSLGERPDDDLAAWREAGADRYLLRFETSDDDLYRRIHPDLPGRVSDRMAILRRLQELGYEAGTGIMVGIPGQTLREHRRRHRPVPRHGHGHDRHRPVPAAPATPLGQESARRQAAGRLAGRPGAQQRADDVQGARAHPPGAAGRQPAGDHGARRWSTRPAAAPTACSAAPTW